MLVGELIKAFKAHFIPCDELKAFNKKAEVDALVVGAMNAATREYYHSMDLWCIRGIGPSRARELHKLGVNVKNIMQHLDKLSMHSQTALKFNIPDRTAHADITRIANQFLIYGKSLATIVGSYRRGSPDSGDIDILYRGDIDKFLEQIHRAHGDHWRVVATGPTKIAGIFEYKKNHAVEIDIWKATKENYHAMLLYSTGSKNHNILMRAIAKRQGMMLNQNGLYRDGVIIPTHSERDIYEALGMKYRAPSER